MLPARPPDPLDLQEQVHLLLKEKGLLRAKAVISDLKVHWLDDTIHDAPLHRPDEVAEQVAAFTRSLGLA
jgi:hypothetical protein